MQLSLSTVVLSASAAMMVVGMQPALAAAQDDPPFIFVSVSPAPNGAGWNHGPVTVTFQCFDDVGIASCPSPVTLTAETNGTVVNGTATDTASQTTSTSVTVKIDKTAPTLTVTSPTAGSNTSLATLAVTADATDDGSGLVSASCDGATATLSVGSVSCSVNLGYGRNFISVQATDAADNKRSIIVPVSRIATSTTLSVKPDQLQLLVNEDHEVGLIDEFGQLAGSPAWSSDHTTVATVATDTDGVTTVTAVAPGTATITGTSGTLSATLALTVVNATSFTSGDVRWIVPALPGFAIGGLIPAEADADGPTMYTIEYSLSDSTKAIRALGNDGTQKWVGQLPAGFNDGTITSDATGGLISNNGTSIIEIGGHANWRYDSPGSLDTRFAQATNGDVFVVESGANGSSALLSLDGASGEPKWRVPLPTSFNADVHEDCGFDTFSSVSGAVTDNPIADADNNVWLQVMHESVSHDFLPCDIGQLTGESTLELLKVTPSGTASWVQLSHDSYSGPLRDVPFGPVIATFVRGFPAQSILNAAGDVLANWDSGIFNEFPQIKDSHTSYVNASTLTATANAIATGATWHGGGIFGPVTPLMIGEGSKVFGHVTDASFNSSFVTLNSTTGSLVSTQSGFVGNFLTSTAGGGLAVNNFSGGVSFLDATGAEVSSAAVSGVHRGSNLWVTSVDGSSLIANVGPPLPAANAPWQAPRGGSPAQWSLKPPYLSNLSGHQLILKQESCKSGFVSVEDSELYWLPFDGYIPSDQLDTAWFKKSDFLRLIVPPLTSGPIFTVPPPFSGIPIPTCNYFDLDFCASSVFINRHTAGYKKEPAWSDRYWDWKYPPAVGFENDTQARIDKCGPEH